MIAPPSWLRAACFAACLPSGGVLLAKLHGLGPMHTLALAAALPGCLLLVAAWAWARRAGWEALAGDLEVGALGGLLGSFAYDLFRVPFHLAGMRVFAPISAFGVWVAGAEMSSRFTEVLGWTYHYSNGITFGIMYALVLPRRHWAWAIAWALLLETIAVVCPFGRVFALRGNYPALAIAYAAHVPYGLLLGWLVWRRAAVRAWLAGLSWPVRAGAVLAAALALVWPLAAPDEAARDARARPGEFRVEDIRLNPDWLRIDAGGAVTIRNPGPAEVVVVSKQQQRTVRVAAGQEKVLAFPSTGIYQVFVQTQRQTRSSFVIVEPVEEPDR